MHLAYEVWPRSARFHERRYEIAYQQRFLLVRRQNQESSDLDRWFEGLQDDPRLVQRAQHIRAHQPDADTFYNKRAYGGGVDGLDDDVELDADLGKDCFQALPGTILRDIGDERMAAQAAGLMTDRSDSGWPTGIAIIALGERNS